MSSLPESAISAGTAAASTSTAGAATTEDETLRDLTRGEIDGCTARGRDAEAGTLSAGSTAEAAVGVGGEGQAEEDDLGNAVAPPADPTGNLSPFLDRSHTPSFCSLSFQARRMSSVRKSSSWTSAASVYTSCGMAEMESKRLTCKPLPHAATISRAATISTQVFPSALTCWSFSMQVSFISGSAAAQIAMSASTSMASLSTRRRRPLGRNGMGKVARLELEPATHV